MTRRMSTLFRPVACEQAIGELVTCSRCVGTWAAAGLATTQVLAPRFGRLLTWTLAGAGVNDFLQAGFTALTRKSNELEALRPSSNEPALRSRSKSSMPPQISQRYTRIVPSLLAVTIVCPSRPANAAPTGGSVRPWSKNKRRPIDGEPTPAVLGPAVTTHVRRGYKAAPRAARSATGITRG